MQHHVEIQRLKKGHELQITALNAEVHQLKAQLEDKRLQAALETQLKAMVKLDEGAHVVSQNLQKQIDDIREMNAQRETASKVLLQEVNDQWINYQAMVEGELNMLKQRLSDFEKGNVEVVLRIDLEDNVKNRVAAPKRPAPVRPEDISSLHSRQSSRASSVMGNEQQGLLHLTSEALARHAQLTGQDDTEEELMMQSYARMNGILSTKSVVKDGSPTPIFEEFSDAAKEALARKLQMRHKRSASTISGQRVAAAALLLLRQSPVRNRQTKQSKMKLGTKEGLIRDIPNNKYNPARLHKPAASASNVAQLMNGKSESYLDRQLAEKQKTQNGSHKPATSQFRASVTGGGIAAQEWANTTHRKVCLLQQQQQQFINNNNNNYYYYYYCYLFCVYFFLRFSISDIDKYLGVDENGNSKIPEELKASEEQLKTLQRVLTKILKNFFLIQTFVHMWYCSAHSFITIFLINAYVEERKHWVEKSKELQDQVAQMEQKLKYTQNKLRDKIEQNTLLQDQLTELQQQLSELPAQTRAEAQERLKLKQQQEKKIRESQQSLYKQIELQTQQLTHFQGVIALQRSNTETLQKELEQSKDKIKSLEKKLEEAQTDLVKQGKFLFFLITTTTNQSAEDAKKSASQRSYLLFFLLKIKRKFELVHIGDKTDQRPSRAKRFTEKYDSIRTKT
ncbi:hypothetical protein RFI_08650 [Reticulomyxa filosa]|uniref:Uncharacterized protein n=1 Tax=Reticulomyxa filosa TaxID=46433 RepID=X6NQB4_RETFI|nr:hypothetical protein RFI_08650 [Reticulomyxa filosa]|eukprot:ETO28480.1 hypothetical protein RFI_08650 [Reticulomyxa filosa]